MFDVISLRSLIRRQIGSWCFSLPLLMLSHLLKVPEMQQLSMLISGFYLAKDLIFLLCGWNRDVSNELIVQYYYFTMRISFSVF